MEFRVEYEKMGQPCEEKFTPQWIFERTDQEFKSRLRIPCTPLDQLFLTFADRLETDP